MSPPATSDTAPVTALGTQRQAAASALELRDVTLTLGSRAGPVEILRGIDLAVPPGQSLSIVGPSGSGKTSLLMVMAGLEPATGGQIEIEGTDIAPLDEDARARLRARRIGIIFQSFHLIPSMTALENVAVPLQFAGRSDAFEVAKARLTDVGLGDRVEHFPTQLSGGEQQRVAIARALSNEPAIVFADEPTGNLDQATGETVIDLLFKLQRERGVTLVLITHDRELAAQCDRSIALRDGQVVSDVPRQAAA